VHRHALDKPACHSCSDDRLARALGTGEPRDTGRQRAHEIVDHIVAAREAHRKRRDGAQHDLLGEDALILLEEQWDEVAEGARGRRRKDSVDREDADRLASTRLDAAKHRQEIIARLPVQAELDALVFLDEAREQVEKVLDPGAVVAGEGALPEDLETRLGNESVRSVVKRHLDGLQGQLEVLHRVVHLGAQVLDAHVHRIGQLLQLGSVLQDGLGVTQLVRPLNKYGARVGVRL